MLMTPSMTLFEPCSGPHEEEKKKEAEQQQQEEVVQVAEPRRSNDGQDAASQDQGLRSMLAVLESHIPMSSLHLLTLKYKQ